jgi:hypothetical protein
MNSREAFPLPVKEADAFFKAPPDVARLPLQAPPESRLAVARPDARLHGSMLAEFPIGDIPEEQTVPSSAGLIWTGNDVAERGPDTFPRSRALVRFSAISSIHRSLADAENQSSGHEGRDRWRTNAVSSCSEAIRSSEAPTQTLNARWSHQLTTGRSMTVLHEARDRAPQADLCVTERVAVRLKRHPRQFDPLNWANAAVAAEAARLILFRQGRRRRRPT